MGETRLLVAALAGLAILSPAVAAANEDYTLCDPQTAAECAPDQVCAFDDEIDPDLGLCDEPPGWGWWFCDTGADDPCDCGYDCVAVADDSPLGFCELGPDHCQCDWADPAKCAPDDDGGADLPPDSGGGDPGSGGGDPGSDGGGDPGSDGGGDPGAGGGDPCAVPPSDDDVLIDPCPDRTMQHGEAPPFDVAYADDPDLGPAGGCAAGGGSGWIPGALLLLGLCLRRRR